MTVDEVVLISWETGLLETEILEVWSRGDGAHRCCCQGNLEGNEGRVGGKVGTNVLSVDLARARETGRGRQADTPEDIPPRGWRDILWRVFWSISEDRILSTSGGVAFFALLAVFPGIAAIVSLYGLFADASTIGKHLSLLSGFLPGGVLQLIAEVCSFPDRVMRPWERRSSSDCLSRL